MRCPVSSTGRLAVGLGSTRFFASTSLKAVAPRLLSSSAETSMSCERCVYGADVHAVAAIRNTSAVRRGMGAAYQGGPHPAMTGASALLRGFNHVLEALDGAVHDPLAVHEERRRAVHVGRATLGHVFLHLLLDVGRVEVLLPARDVETNLARILLQLVDAEIAGVLEHDVVHLPELALLARRDRGLRRVHRVRVHRRREREI